MTSKETKQPKLRLSENQKTLYEASCLAIKSGTKLVMRNPRKRINWQAKEMFNKWIGK